MQLRKLFEQIYNEAKDSMRYGSTLGNHEDDDDYKARDMEDNDENGYIVFDPDGGDYYGSCLN